MMESFNQKLEEAQAFVRTKSPSIPRIGIVLGSGLGAFVDEMENKTAIPYNDIPHFKKVTVPGHEGKLIMGRVRGIEVVALQGRFHFYEGHSLEDVVFPVRLLHRLGIQLLILTNAAGGVNLSYRSGDLMVITDHINLTGNNPLIGPNDDVLGPRFPDMSHTYNEELIAILEQSARELKVRIQKGVYVGVLGPTYETPAEIRMFRIMGGDAVGMSTVPEAIVANHLGLKICGISCVTNMGAGITNKKLRHEDIKEEAHRVMNDFTKLLIYSMKKFNEAIKNGRQ